MLVPVDGFPEVPLEVVEASGWMDVASGRWRDRNENIVVLESRALTRGFEILASTIVLHPNKSYSQVRLVTSGEVPMVGSWDKSEKTGSDTLKTTVANNDLVWNPRRGKRLVTASPPSLTKQAKENTKLPHEAHQCGCSPRDRQPLRKNLRAPTRKLHQEASEHHKGTDTERFRSHRLSSRGGYLWETPSRGRFTDSL